MAKDDLMAHAASDVDFYALLDVQFESSASDIRRAYRKTALKYHPDKLGAAFDPEKFHLLQIANDVLSDEAAKAAYDQRRSAKIQKQKQERLFEGRRRQMKEELEARERGGVSSASTGVKRQRDEAQEMDAEIRKLAEEGKRRRMEMQSRMSEAEKRSATPERVQTPLKVEKQRERTPQTAQEEKEEEDEVARLERRIKELAEVKEKKRAEKKARKSGIFPQSETPSASPKPESLHSVGGFGKRNAGAEAKQDTPRRAFDDIKSATPVSSPKFSFSPKPRTAPAGGNDEFAATMQRLKDAEKKRLEDEIRKQEAEAPITAKPKSFKPFSSEPEPPIIAWTGKETQSLPLKPSRPSISASPASQSYCNTTTFPRFPELPVELQLQIWSYAAIPSKSIPLKQVPFYRSIKSWLPDPRPPQKVMEVHGCLHSYAWVQHANLHKRGPKEPYVLRIVPEALLGTCRLARLVGLERWKKEIENIPVLKAVRGAGAAVKAFKEEVVEGLLREIKKLKGGE